MTAQPIPDSALQEHAIALGKTRSGKSYSMHGEVERLIDRDRRVCILVPSKGDWWGLKSSADGKKPGYPVTIFGSPEYPHHDIPIDERAGAPIGRLIAGGASPTIVDLSRFSVDAREKFATAFAQELMRTNAGTLYLFIDECHNFMPQTQGGTGSGSVQRNMMLRAFNTLINEGLGMGIHVRCMSQRPAKCHKDSVTQIDTLIAFRVVHPLDRKAVSDWIDACGDPEKGKEVLRTVGTLTKGEAWVWSSEGEFGPARIKFPKIKTFDSHATPDPDRKVVMPKAIATGDLDKIRAELGSAIKEAEANDPKLLRLKVAALEKELKAKKPATAAPAKTVPDTAAIERAVMAERQSIRRALASILKDLTRSGQRLTTQASGFTADLTTFSRGLSAIAELIAAPAAPIRVPRIVPPESITPGPAPRPRPIPSQNGHAATRPGPHSRILAALAWCRSIGDEQPARTLVAAAARYSPTSTGFTNPLGALRAAGLIEYPDSATLRLTEAGIAEAPPVEAPPTLRDFHESVVGVLKGPEQRILRAVIAHGPELIGREKLASDSGYSHTSTGFTNPLGALRSKGLIDYPNSESVQATKALFPEGLA